MITAPPTRDSLSSALRLSARRISADTSTGVSARPCTRKRTTFASPSPAGANSYGPSLRVSGSLAPRPMNRFTLTIVSRGCSAARAAAARPTTTLPRSSNATTDGTSSSRSQSGIASGRPSRTCATSELVVPRSMPIGFGGALGSKISKRVMERSGPGAQRRPETT